MASSDRPSWRAGAPAPPSLVPAPAAPPPAEGAPEAEAAAADWTPQSTISDDRMYDLYWTHSPTDMIWVIISRREKKKKAKSRMPVILRNLAPDSVFDPRDAWGKEKVRLNAEKDTAAAAAKGAAQEEREAKGGKKKKEKVVKVSKKDEMIAKNKEAKSGKEISSDWEKLDNTAKAAKRGATEADLRGVKTTTPAGGLRKLLMVLEASAKAEELPSTLDVLWAIEANPLFVAGEAEVTAAKADKDDKKDDKKKDKKDKKDKDKKDSKKDSKPSGKAPPLSTEGQLVSDYRKELKKAREARKKCGLVEYQLTSMHDRLPPLSVYNRKFQLDAWQCRVLELVDADRSAVVCAPTSSGKTVISTYVAVKVAEEAKASSSGSEGGVLFVVPSEPLVWQVAAMFEKMLPGQVALCTDLMAYRPESAEGQSNVVVGTPNALESALSKVRGLVGAERKKRGQDYAQMAGGFGFRYAVFDECHSLDGDEGGALQRLMRLVECPFLALSATIGNGASLRAFWTTVRSGHRDCIPALVEAAAAAEGRGNACAVRDPEVYLEVHEGRFINLQRLLLKPAPANALAGTASAATAAVSGGFVKAEDVAKTVILEPLHPCAAVDLATLARKSFAELSIAFTPRDSFALWKAIEKHCVRDKKAVAHLDPATFFSQFGDVSHHQITLAQAKEYEGALKGCLETMAKDTAGGSDECGAILADFQVPDVEAEPCAQANGSGTASSAEGSSASTGSQLFAFALKCRDQRLFPCLCFQLDSFKCLEMYKELLGTLESRQRAEFPNYYAELEAKAEAERKKAVEAAKAAGSAKKAKGKKDDEDGGGGGAEEPGGGDELVELFIDTAAPHEQYVLSPPSARISTIEFDDILEEMKKDKEPLPANHPLARGLRRGLGIYIDDVGMSVYRRVVQRLAQQGKLAIVFSDHSLAYGVNMPFRTCAFCGDMSGLLTPLMAQQMSGRTGRRGLDTQGNIVYLDMQWGEIKQLILGQIPDIAGEDQLYPTMALQPALSDFVDRRLGRNTTLPTFHQHQTSAEAAAEGYFDMSARLMAELGLLDEEGVRPALSPPALTTCWEMRTQSIAEALAVVHSLPLLMQDFVKDKSPDYAEKEVVQVDFFARLLHLVDRRSPYAEIPGLLPGTPFHALSYVTKYPERQASWDKWEAHLAAGQARFAALPADLLADLKRTGAWDQLTLPVPPGDPIDATAFTCILHNRLPLELPSTVKYDLKKRLFKIGTTIVKMHNCLCQPGEFQGLEPLLRKCFTRLKYVLTDAIKNETSLQDTSGTTDSAAAAEAAEGAAAAAAGSAGASGGVAEVTAAAASLTV